MAVIRCVGGAASRSYIDYFTDVLLALNKKYFDNLCRQVALTIHASSFYVSRYMNTMVATENFPTELCSREAKEQFARAVLKERANKRKLQVLTRCWGPCAHDNWSNGKPFYRKRCVSFPSSQGGSLGLSMQHNWSNWGSEAEDSTNNHQVPSLETNIPKFVFPYNMNVILHSGAPIVLLKKVHYA